MDIAQLNLQKKSPPEVKEKKPRKKKVVTSAYFDNLPSELSSDDDFKTPIKPKKMNELRLSGDVPKDEAEEKIMLAMALSASEKISSPPSSNGSTPRDLAGFSAKNTPEKSFNLEEELLADDIPSTPQIKQSALQDKYKYECLVARVTSY